MSIIQLQNTVDGLAMLTPESVPFHTWVLHRREAVETKPFYVLVHGPAGSGKSCLLKAINQSVSAKKGHDFCIATAPTEIAANLIDGYTIHSTFILEWGRPHPSRFMKPLEDHERQKLSSIRHAKLLLIDNINYLDCVDFARIDHRLQDLTGIQKPFGGLSVIVFGDFHQIPPPSGCWVFGVLPDEFLPKVRENTPASPEKLWSLFKIFELSSRNMRVPDDDNDIYEVMREGKVENAWWNYLNNMCAICPFDRNLTDDRVVSEYVNACDDRPDYDVVLLTTTNDMADELNQTMVCQYGNHQNYPAKQSDGANYPKRSKTSRCDLTVSVGSPVIVIDNVKELDIRSGAIGCVLNYSDALITLSFPGRGSPKLVSFSRIEYENENGYYEQFPLQLAYALTVQKAQGATFDQVFFVRNNLSNAYGQLYTAMSRCRELEDSKISPIRFLHYNDTLVGKKTVVENELERMRVYCRA